LGSVNEYQLRKAGMAHSECGWTCGCAGKTLKSLENTRHTWALLQWWFTYEEALYQVYAPLPFTSGDIHLLPLSRKVWYLYYWDWTDIIILQ